MLDIYKASAGAGKTFALTLEYFKTIFVSPAEYKNILAVTFTNKATEEMKSRIINELHRLADGKTSDYGEVLKQEFGFTDEQLKNRAVLLRTMLLHDYGRLAVTTIDRFFQRIIKAFTRELGIFPGYNVELDSDFVLLKAVDKVMQQMKDNPGLKNWISELMSSNVEEGKSWSIKSKIAELGEELFKENYMLFDKHILDKFSDKEFLKNYRSFLTATVQAYESRQAAIGQEAIGLIRSEGLEQTDFKGGKAGCVSYFYKLVAGNFDEPTATVRKGAQDSAAWVTKTSPRKATIGSICPRLMQLLQDILNRFDQDYSYYLSARMLSDNLYQLGILNDLYQEVRAYCDEKGLMLLSDTTHILNMLIADNDTSFLFEKCGNYYKHLMIDEFQDTSGMQWKNFRPLVVNSLSEGCRTMIVGDVKQSIYRWRNGDWSLLANEVERQFSSLGVNTVILKNNWRSAPEIVNFNNTFFEKAVGMLTDLYIADAGGEVKEKTIAEAYQGLQQIPRKKKKGYVDIVFGPDKKAEGGENIILADLIAIIRDIRQRGGQLKDIVILVRGGKEGALVADFLMEYNKTADRPIGFISNDSLYVWSSPYIQFIIAILKYMVDPYDMVNKTQILYFYRVFIQDENNPDLHDIFSGIGEKELFEVLGTDFELDKNKIMSYSLYETIETILDKFSLRKKREEIPYLIAFQDIIYEYETNNSNSITLFLDWWEKEQGKRVLTTSEEVDAVRILTIHKSKGLEFEFVLLPFCSWELDSVRPVRRIWCMNNEQGFNQLDYAPLNYSSKLTNTIFKKDYLDEHLKAYIDNLNLLYVALTRAKTELYVRPYSPKINKDGSISMPDIGAFIYSVLAETELVDNATMQVALGEKQCFPSKAGAGQTSVTLQNYPVFQPGERISIKYKFRDYTEPQQASLSAIDEGKLLHEIFKHIRYAGDVSQAVQQAYLEGLISIREKEAYCAKIEAYISNPQASEWFGPENNIMNERDILFPGGRKTRPDRIIFNGSVVRIIDYKFGQSEENKYLKQVGFYCNTLRKMGFKEVEGYVWYVKSGKIVQV